MRAKKIVLVLISIIMATSLIGCRDTTLSTIIEPVAKVEYPKSIAFDDFDNKREVWDNNQVSTEYIKALNGFSNKSAVELLTKQERTANIMYSPISLYMALALSASGAGGETQDEILSVLNMKDLGVKQLEEQTGNLFRLLYTDNEIGKLKIANSLWLDEDISFKEPYLDIASRDYYASLFCVDFSEKEKTQKLISNWISKNTNGMLKSHQPINDEQILSIINTIYFYDEWTDKFNKDKTKEDVFHSYDGEDVLCDFMNKTCSSKAFIDGEGYISSSLNFKNHASMNFYLPDDGVNVYDLISTQEKVDALLDEDNPKNERKFGEVVFQIPKFNFGSTLNLKDHLENMGIQSAFMQDADFTDLTDEIAFISDIMQSTHISIDEKGCEASAFTQIHYCTSALPKDNAEIILDRPFIFSITSSNGVVLFLGVINNPTV